MFPVSKYSNLCGYASTEEFNDILKGDLIMENQNESFSEEKYDEDIDEKELEEDTESLEKKYDKAQRELVTQTVDFNIKNLADMVSAKQIDTNPKYQRRLRWDEERQSKLIESFLLNVPIPPLFLAEEKYGKYAVIDGQQRLRALSAFFSDRLTLSGLKVFPEINDQRFSDLPNELQTILSLRPTQRCVIILRQSHPEIKFEVFERLNTGGVKLNAQEIRNSAFRGPLNDLILDLSENALFRKLLKIKMPKSSKLVQHMRDCELILRFLALKDTWREFPGSLKSTLNGFMETHQNADELYISKLRDDFLVTLETVSKAFGDNVFRRYEPAREDWGKQVLASVFDAQMCACYSLKNDIGQNRTKIIKNFKALFSKDPTFLEAIGAGTNQKSKIIYRVQKICDCISKGEKCLTQQKNF